MAQKITISGNDADANVIGIDLVAAATATATTGTYEAGIRIDNAENTADSMTNAIVITSSGINNGITDAIDVSDTNITNGINLGANLLVSNGDSINDFTGNGLAMSTNSLTVDTTLGGDGLSATTSSGSGLETLATGVSLLQGCAEDQILRWDETADVWECDADQATVQIVKQADENVTSSIALQDDNELLFSIGANQDWAVETSYTYTTGGNSSPDINVAYNNTATSPTCTYGTVNISHAGNIAAGSITCDTALAMTTSATGVKNGVLTGGMTSGAGGGTVAFRWSQRVSNGTSTRVEDGSYLFAFQVTGADLAEVYYTTELGVDDGTIVSLDPNILAGVVKSTTPYDNRVLGIISTKPGLVMGGAHGNGVPVLVALTGRVPIKVSDENGIIKAGDYLTSSSTPGVAMKATRAGPVIGQALISQTQTGQDMVVAFIKNGFFPGQSSVDLLADNAFTGPDITANQNLPPAAQILKTLTRMRGDGPVSGQYTNLSEIYTDRVVAGLEIITPTLYADEIIARKLRVEEIEGLEYLLATPVASSSAVLAQSSPDDPPPELTPIPINLTELAQLTVTGALTVSGPAQFADTLFTGRPTFNSDTAGFAVIKEGADEVGVKFDQEYAATPVINATITADDAIALEQLLLTADLRYIITRRTTQGFVIKLASPATQDVPFSWIAIAINNAQTSTSPNTPLTDILTSPTPLPTVTLEPPTPTLEPPPPTTPEPTPEPTPASSQP